MSRILRVLGYILLVAGCGLILMGSIGTLLTEGWRAFLWLFSPFNWTNFLVMLLTLAPGFLCLKIANKLSFKTKVE